MRKRKQLSMLFNSDTSICTSNKHKFNGTAIIEFTILAHRKNQNAQQSDDNTITKTNI